MDTVRTGGEHRVALILAAAVFAVWAGLTGLALKHAALPAETDGMVLAVFPPGTGETAVFEAVVRAGGEPVRRTWIGFAWVAQGSAPGFVGRLVAEGAWAAYGELPLAGPSLGGCAVVSEDRRKPARYRLGP